MKYLKQIIFCSIVMVALVSGAALGTTNAQQSSGSVGVEGRIGSDPPTSGATITVPRDGQTFSELPINVSGLCTGDVLVKLFKNNVFGGSAQCRNGSFSITTDLFNGRNELIARVYDALDQAGPDSNMVTVTFIDNRPGAGSRPTLTSNYAKRGANPGETLTWPIILSGGRGPYAISVDWGDGKPSDLFTQTFAGTFNISHVYDSPGVYNIIVRVSDANDAVAFLQVVGVANGSLSQQDDEATPPAVVRTRLIWRPFLFLVPLMLIAFWLGKKHQMQVIRRQIESREK